MKQKKGGRKWYQQRVSLNKTKKKHTQSPLQSNDSHKPHPLASHSQIKRLPFHQPDSRLKMHYKYSIIGWTFHRHCLKLQFDFIRFIRFMRNFIRSQEIDLFTKLRSWPSCLEWAGPNGNESKKRIKKCPKMRIKKCKKKRKCKKFPFLIFLICLLNWKFMFFF